jgi:DNA polymerase V
MYALCDVNSMYASCEKVFDPAIRKRPVVVLTNNDGCICAACGIAKQMGVGKKFVPYFQVKDQLEQAGAVIRSSNYELYAELSQRLMETCARFAPHSNIYSIDEIFLYYGKHTTYIPPEGWLEHARKIRKTVWREVRLPIGVGMGRTPTLAKAANHAAKRIDGYNGVAVIDTEFTRKHILSNMKATDVWGIGRKLGARLKDLGILTALQLANQPPALMKKQFSILVESTVHELNNKIMLNWDDVRAPKKEIYSTRSFGQRITDSVQLRFALASHVEIAARKLRKQNSLAHSLTIFATSSPHDSNGYYRKSVFHHFSVPTSDSRVIMAACSEAVDTIFKKGIKFYRCGIGLLDISDATNVQHDLFSQSQDSPELMRLMDSINIKYGRETVQLAGRGIEHKFAMRREFLSPQYTTRWSDIPRVYCV